MVRKKTWVKSKKELTIKCGTCLMCDKVLMSNEVVGVVNANKDYFCENIEPMNTVALMNT